MKNCILIFLVSILSFPVLAQEPDTVKKFTATRIYTAPKIDGKPDDAVWQSLPVMNHFTQYKPDFGAAESQKTEVRIAYDDKALFVLAFLYDNHPDSVLREFGARDNFDINADYFRFCFDPYGKHQDSYIFGVTAAGVQFDIKNFDETFDAVWESAVSVNPNGWVAEFRIPYSAIRFPAGGGDIWSFQCNRSVRRNREFTQWSQTPLEANNPLVYWGHLTGLKDIDPPLRLSFTPYMAAYAEKTPLPDNGSGKTSYENSYSYNAGMDVKYGVDERFTIDMTLLPDFGQVQSDNKIKNLSYRETTYDENRPFFKEGSDLFNRNNLFYSRRIGKVPSGFYSAESQLSENEKLIENPSQVKLLNAMRFSGRTGNGLGIGLFNAITDNCYAIAENSAGQQRKILTEPLTNYNAFTLDQQLKNNSDIYLYNTNVMRDGKAIDANVSSAGFLLSNKKNTYEVGMDGGMSSRFSLPGVDGNTTDENGYAYRFRINKLGGSFGYGFERLVYDNRYYTSDLGFQTINNNASNTLNLSYSLFKPWKFIRSSYNNLNYSLATHYVTGKITENVLRFNSFTTLKNYLTIITFASVTPGNFYDFFEPRVEGRFQKGVRYFYAYAGISTDYRKQLALDQSFTVSNGIGRFLAEGYNSTTGLRYRISDRATVKLEVSLGSDPYNIGAEDFLAGDTIIYGVRKLYTNTVQLTGSYVFTKNMYLTLNARHYRAWADHRYYATLLSDGSLEQNDSYVSNNNFNYNVFNIDFVFSWMFAPGSTLSLVYKNIIENEEGGLTQFKGYGDNLKNVLNDPQTNSISLKAIYYLDYLYFKKNK